MDYSDQGQAEELIRDPDFLRGLNGLVNAFAVRWLLEGAGLDAVSVSAGGPDGPVMRFLIVAAPLTDEGKRTIDAGERAFYRAVNLHVDKRDKAARR